MHVLVKNSIFDGTLLENLPFEYRWYESRPKNLYTVNNNKIVIKNHKDWYDINRYNSKEWLCRMFIHDICHLVLYAERGQHQHIFTDDFGLTWEDTKLKDGRLIFDNFDEFMDEYKVVMLSNILEARTRGEVKTKKEMVKLVVESLNYIYMADEIHLGDKETAKRRKERMNKSYDFWLSAKHPRLEGAIVKLRNILQERGFKR